MGFAILLNGHVRLPDMRLDLRGGRVNFTRLIMLLWLLATPAVLAGGQITVTGEGRVDRVPDMAVITLGVSHQAPTAPQAVSEVAQTAAGILATLGDIGIAQRDLRTSDLSLVPLRSPRSSGTNPPDIQGFEASNQITVRLRDLALLGDLLGQVTHKGANLFRGLHFALQDPEPALNEARRLAVADGRARAQLYAGAAGVTLGPLLSLSEPGTSPAPLAMSLTRAGMADMAMPVAEGEVTLSTSVIMVFDIAAPAQD